MDVLILTEADPLIDFDYACFRKIAKIKIGNLLFINEILALSNLIYLLFTYFLNLILHLIAIQSLVSLLPGQ